MNRVHGLEELVSKNIPAAMFVLAVKYRDGSPYLSRDNLKALDLLRRSSKLGFDHALAELGRAYLFEDMGVHDVERGGSTWTVPRRWGVSKLA